ncbi:hypothetical protein GMORB2_6671 [Geosmithia morbida]|uniref:Uncharacterized protein n=1 Tax=Geosmithia morbida TaxID=1094350 RepID=A0A9P5D0U9_9HYPO|nr:uncharacterized protein GMORB2_6671 [Geosmithia morbida]KAF4123123.1 hypothetical protein GMORB2_6671 [Geosmithia morbida]
MLQRSLLRSGTRRLVSSGVVRHQQKQLAGRVAVRHQSFSSNPGSPATITDSGFWKSLIPKPMRKENRAKKKSSSASAEWNPATFYVVIFLLIGSMSIQMITLRSSFQGYMRRSEVKIALLRDVVDKIQRGEKVDVEKALGTGNAEREADWEEVLRTIESEDGAPKASKRTNRQDTEPTDPASKQQQQKQPAPVAEETTQTTEKPSAGFGSFF